MESITRGVTPATSSVILGKWELGEHHLREDPVA